MARLATAMALSGGLAFVAPRAPARGPSTPARHGAPGGSASGSAAWVPVASAAVAAAAQGRSARRAVGVCLPLTEKFDPLELGTEERLERYSQVEIKHGRVAMIATMGGLGGDLGVTRDLSGYILPEFFRFPGCESFQHGLAALNSIPVEGWGAARGLDRSSRAPRSCVEGGPLSLICMDLLGILLKQAAGSALEL